MSTSGTRTTAAEPAGRPRSKGPRLRWRRLLPLRVVTAAALVTDAVVHLQLAVRYDANTTGAISQGDLFRLEAVVALVAAAVLVMTGRWLAWLIALLVAGSALGAVLLYGYVDPGPLGPVPDMYEPIWYGQKLVAAFAEAVGTLTAATGLLLASRRR